MKTSDAFGTDEALAVCAIDGLVRFKRIKVGSRLQMMAPGSDCCPHWWADRLSSRLP